MNRLLVEKRTSRRGPVGDRYFIETRRYRAVMRAQTQIVAVPQAYNGIVEVCRVKYVARRRSTSTHFQTIPDTNLASMRSFLN